MKMAFDAKGKVPKSWNCVDCGINTVPGAKSITIFIVL
jgi:hypothetical protein